MPIPASNARLNLLWQDITSGHYSILSFVNSSLQDDNIQFPESFFEKVVNEFHQQWYTTQYKFETERMAVTLAKRQDFPFNLHERLFAERKDKIDYLVLLSSHHTTTEQLNILIDEFTNLGVFGEAISYSMHVQVFQKIILDRFNKILTKKYVDHPYISNYEEYYPKVIELLDEKELIDAIRKHPQWLQSMNFLPLLAKRTVSPEGKQRILDYMKELKSDPFLALYDPDITRLSLSQDADEIDQILKKLDSRNALMIAANNPFARKETLEEVAKNICERAFRNEEPIGFVKDVLKQVPIYETVFELIMKDLDRIDGQDDETYYETLSEIANELFEKAPLDMAIPLAKKWNEILHEFMGHKDVNPFFMRRGVEDEELWKIFFKGNQSISDLGNEWLDFWRSIPDKFFSLVPIEEMGTDTLLGVYSREDISDEFRQALFDEISRRMNSSDDSSNEWNRTFILCECIPYILASNTTLPRIQEDRLKAFIMDHLEENIVKFIPLEHYSQSEIIKKMVELHESEDTSQKYLFIEFLERSNLSNHIKTMFDEPPQWGDAPEKEFQTSMS